MIATDAQIRTNFAGKDAVRRDRCCLGAAFVRTSLLANTKAARSAQGNYIEEKWRYCSWGNLKKKLIVTGDRKGIYFDIASGQKFARYQVRIIF